MAVPRITQVIPEKAPTGTEVILQGENLQIVKKVTFSGIEAKFKIESGSQIRATVPSVENLGNINVKVQDDTGKGAGKGKFQLVIQETQTLETIPVTASKAALEIALAPETETNNQRSETNFRDLNRHRAEAAWQDIQEIDAKNTDYGSLAREMPTLIQVNGLAQTLAFLKAKNKVHHQKMFEHLSNWVCQQLHFQQGNLLENLLRTDSQTYRRATVESLSFLQWLKRFAEAKIEKVEDKAR